MKDTYPTFTKIIQFLRFFIFNQIILHIFGCSYNSHHYNRLLVPTLRDLNVRRYMQTKH